MWLSGRYSHRRNSKFFRINFCYDNLKNYFETNFALMQHHKYNLNDIENMIPWEKTIYVKDTAVTIPYSKDNYLFAIQSIDELGHASLPVFPVPVK